jgi:hypothetical protein
VSDTETCRYGCHGTYEDNVFACTHCDYITSCKILTAKNQAAKIDEANRISTLERELAEAKARADELKHIVNNLRFIPSHLDDTPMTDNAEFAAEKDNANGPNRVNSEFCRLVERKYYFQKARAEKAEAELVRKDEALAEANRLLDSGMIQHMHYSDGEWSECIFEGVNLREAIAAALAQGGKDNT